MIINPQAQPKAEELRHTPTPWIIEKIGSSGPKIYQADAEGMAVCQLFDKHGSAFANSKANAALIVEAVNSRAALTSRVEELEKALRDAVELMQEAVDCYYVASGKIVIDGQDGYYPLRDLRLFIERRAALQTGGEE